MPSEPKPKPPKLAPHLVAPLPEHQHYRHDPNLPSHIARRLEATVRPILPDPLTRGWAPLTPAREVLHPVLFREFKLIGKSQLSPNTARYRFGLPHEDDCLGLPVGQHISIAADIAGRRVIRSYTPTSLDNERGYFDIVTYEHGTVSQYLASLHIGDAVLVRGPKGNFDYHPNLARHLLMIAGGSGITPMYQIAKSSVLDHDDRTQLRLIYANIQEEDILLRNELTLLEEQSRGRFKAFYVLEHAPEHWTGGIGYVTKEHIQNNLPPHDDVKVLLCGPPPMTAVMKKHLRDLHCAVRERGISLPDDQVYVF